MNKAKDIQEGGMKNYLYETIYNGDHYLVPYYKMGSWYAYIKDLSIFVRDAGNLQIAFHDAFNKHKIKTKPHE